MPTLVESLLGIAVSESQVYRTIRAIDEVLADPCVPSQEMQQTQNQGKQPVYAMVDGSFLFTDAGWKEVKVGRVFTAIPDATTGLDWHLNRSEYVAQRGHYEKFTRQFEILLPPKSPCKKVFVTDGAAWITNWITTSYPNALQILDFFHVCEKLAAVAARTPCRKHWFEEQKALLLTGEVALVRSSIKELKAFEGKQELLAYLENNAFRMNYALYRKQKLMISSGPIESAHRTVLQARMKRSGQRWSDAGCDAIVKLRVAYRSGKGNHVTNLLKKQLE